MPMLYVMSKAIAEACSDPEVSTCRWEDVHDVQSAGVLPSCPFLWMLYEPCTMYALVGPEALMAMYLWAMYVMSEERER